jgi:hypothetical protein
MAKDKWHKKLEDYCRVEFGTEVDIRIADFGEVIYAMLEKDGRPYRVVQYNIWYEDVFTSFKLDYAE